MIEGPIGAASYNNEFGRPNILGYFRTLEKHNTMRKYWLPQTYNACWGNWKHK